MKLDKYSEELINKQREQLLKEVQQRKAIDEERMQKKLLERQKRAEAQIKAKENFFHQKLENETKKDVICIETSDVWYKEVALNYLLTHGYICVQNEFSCTQTTCYHVMTFVKSDKREYFLKSQI